MDLHPDRLYSGPQARWFLGCSAKTLYLYGRDGRCPARFPGGPGTRPRFLGADILRTQGRDPDEVRKQLAA